MSEKDKSLFLEAMQELEGIEPLKETEHQPLHNAQKQKFKSSELLKKVKRKQRNHHNQSKNALDDELTQAVQYDFSGTKVGAFESLFYCQPGVRTQELSKLKKGQFNAQAVLDLHGLTVQQGEQALDDFIALCCAQNKRFIRVIHGKGYNSDDEYPALKNLTNQLLSQLNEVIAFTSAPEKDGGVGAVNVLLKAL